MREAWKSSVLVPGGHRHRHRHQGKRLPKNEDMTTAERGGTIQCTDMAPSALGRVMGTVRRPEAAKIQGP